MVFDTSCRSFPKLKSGPLCGPIAGKPAPTSYSAHLIPVLSLWGAACRRWRWFRRWRWRWRFNRKHQNYPITTGQMLLNGRTKPVCISSTCQQIVGLIPVSRLRTSFALHLWPPSAALGWIQCHQASLLPTPLPFRSHAGSTNTCRGLLRAGNPGSECSSMPPPITTT